MLSTFRAIAKSRITLVILFIPLMLGLLVFGNVRDAFSSMRIRDSVVSAGSRSVSPADFKRVFDNARKDFEQRNGRPITPEEAAAQGAVDDILQSLAQREGFMAALTKAGIHPSEKLIAEQLRKIPAFFDPITGQFDAKLFQQRLAANGLSNDAFLAGERDELSQSHFSGAVAGGLRTPAIFSALNAHLLLEQRTFSAFGIDPATVPPPPKPTDDQLVAFIKAHADQMMQPEMRTLTVVRFSARALAPSLPVDPAELQKRYDFRKDTLSTPEKRTVVQIAARDAAGAAAVAARLSKGENPAAVAKSLGVEPVTYPDAPRSAISDPKIAQAAFSLPPGQVSAPIQGGLAWAVVKVLAVTPGRTVTLEQARPALEAELRAETAQDRIYAVVEKYQMAHEGGANLAESAKAAAVTPLQLPPVTSDGADREGRPQPILSPKLLKEAFGQPEGGETDVLDDGKGEYFAVRVDKVIAPALPTLAQDRDRITAFYLRTEQIRILKERLEALAARARKGESMDALAASVGAKVSRVTLDRRQAEQDQSQRRQLLSQAFAAKPNEVFTMGSGLVKVETIRQGSPEDEARMTVFGQQQLRPALFQDFGSQALAWSRKAMKVRVDANRARQAIGLPPVEDAKGGKKPDAAPGAAKAPAK